MQIAIITGQQIVSLFLILFIGIISYKIKIINDIGNKTLSDLLLLVVSPCLIFSAYQVDFDLDKLKGLGVAAFFSAIAMIIALVVASIFIRKTSKGDYMIERMSIEYPNIGYMGIPLIAAIFGQDGVFYVSAYITVFNIMLWSYGVMFISGESNIKSLIKAMFSSNIIAIIIGVIFYVLEIRLPDMILGPIKSVSNMNTPLAMLIAGASLATVDLKSMLKNKRMYFIAFLRLIFTPIITMIIILMFHGDYMVSTIVILLSACPCASVVTSFALRYKKDSLYASELFSFTTILSIITIPIIMIIYSMFIS